MLAQFRAVEPGPEQQGGLAAMGGHPPQVIGDPAADASLGGVVFAQHGDEAGLVLAEQLREDGGSERKLVREMVIQRADTHLGFATHLVEGGRQSAVEREPASCGVQQPGPRVGAGSRGHEDYSS